MSLLTRAAAAAVCVFGLILAPVVIAGPFCAGMWIEVNGGGGPSYMTMARDACTEGEGVSSCHSFTLNLNNPNHVCHQIY